MYLCGQITSANFVLIWLFFIRTTAVVNDDNDGDEMEDGEDNDLDNDGDNVSDDEELDEEV